MSTLHNHCTIADEDKAFCITNSSSCIHFLPSQHRCFMDGTPSCVYNNYDRCDNEHAAADAMKKQL